MFEWLFKRPAQWPIDYNEVWKIRARQLREDESDVTYRRIYHETGYPGTLAISGNVYDRKQQDPNGCTTIGWILQRGARVIRVENAVISDAVLRGEEWKL